MPRAPKKRGRKRKFQMGDVAWSKQDDGYVVIVDYKQDDSFHARYRVVRLLHHPGALMVGPAVWRETPTLDKTPENYTYKRAAGTYRANGKLEERGCSCNCCVHQAIPRSQVRADGTFKWEEEVDDDVGSH